jgi:hypothetical protein
MKDSNIWIIGSTFYGLLHLYELFNKQGSEVDYWGSLILAIVMLGFSRVYHHQGD